MWETYGPAIIDIYQKRLKFKKTLDIFAQLGYNQHTSGSKWCKVVSFPHYPPSFPQNLTEGSAMFLGEYQFVLDAKGRVFIPAKFREALGDKFVITRGIDNCLAVYPQEEWKTYTDKINELPSSTARRIRRFVFSGACEAESDSHGRTLIPQNLREYAGFDNDSKLVITGAGSFIEIWSEKAWNAERELESSEEIASLMETLGC